MEPAPPHQEDRVNLSVSTARETAEPRVDFRALFDREAAYVVRSLRRLGVHERDCEDIGNEVFVKVHDKLSLYDRSRPLRPWLFAFCVRLASDYRKLARHREHFELESTAVADGTPERDLIEQQKRELVLVGLRALDTDKCAVFTLHELDEVPIPDVARALEIAEGTAYSRLRAARQEFTAAVRREQAKRSSP